MGECEICSAEDASVFKYTVLNASEIKEELCDRCAGVLSTVASVRSIERVDQLVTDP
jgi:protein-arginine kinase activator protein McsA